MGINSNIDVAKEDLQSMTLPLLPDPPSVRMTVPMDELTESIRDHALKLGFHEMGVARADTLEQDEIALDRWLESGQHGGMEYMARAPHRRSRPEEVLPGAESVVVLAMNYYNDDSPVETKSGDISGVGKISRYAWGKDYHGVFEKRLKSLEAFIKDQGGPGTQCRSYVDYGPVLEKAMAREAGLGFIGKNTLLITESFGSWVFLAVILTTLRLDPSGPPQTSQCGSCQLCLEACPTGAIVQPYILDARRCISYLTIENKGDIPAELQGLVGDWVFGCDICQEVCPFNAHSRQTDMKAFLPVEGAGSTLKVDDLLACRDDVAFRNRFAQTPLMRAKKTGLHRNASVVQKNLFGSSSRKQPS